MSELPLHAAAVRERANAAGKRAQQRKKDIEFLEEMGERLAEARAGDWTQAEMLAQMINDWIDELQRGQHD